MKHLQLATLTIETKVRRPPATSHAIEARERDLISSLAAMLPCLPRLQVSELQLQICLDASAERWQILLAPRRQGVLENAFRLDEALDADASMLWADLQSLPSRLGRAIREVRVDIESGPLPLRYKTALHAFCLRAERSSWCIDMQIRQFSLFMDGALDSRRDAVPLRVQARLHQVNERSVSLRQVEIANPDDPQRIVCRMPGLRVFVEREYSGAALMVNHKSLYFGQVWEGLVALERSTLSGKVVGAVLCPS